MKNIFLSLSIAILGFILTGTADAQLILKLSSEKPLYLRYEPVMVTLQIKNVSGNTLRFDGTQPYETGSLAFKVTAASGNNVRAFGSINLQDSGLKLAPGQSKELKFPLNQYYNMQRDDHYTVTALVNHGRLARTHISSPISIDVMEGMTVMTRSIGLPSDNTTSVIKAVNLTLMHFTDVNEEIYCLRAEDDDNVYATYRLGSYIDGEKPQMELDDTSLVHLLLQIRPRLYAYFIFGFNGRNPELRQKRFYISSDGIPPTLSRSTGYWRIEHGKLAREGVDYTESK